MSPDIVQCSQFSAVAALSLHQMQSSRSGSILDPASVTAAIAEARAASRARAPTARSRLVGHNAIRWPSRTSAQPGQRARGCRLPRVNRPRVCWRGR